MIVYQKDGSYTELLEMYRMNKSRHKMESKRWQEHLYLWHDTVGNLEDMTFRAVRILKEADLIAAEDTRNSIKLLNHFEIKTPDDQLS